MIEIGVQGVNKAVLDMMNVLFIGNCSDTANPIVRRGTFISFLVQEKAKNAQPQGISLPFKFNLLCLACRREGSRNVAQSCNIFNHSKCLCFADDYPN